MNKKIKFRAWVEFEDGHKMDTVSSMHSAGENYWYVTVASDDEAYQFENPPIMQFTGLQDKNGVDIYEGDITNEKEEVYEDTGSYYVGGDFLSNKNTEIEVIGNIYENPKLLNNKE